MMRLPARWDTFERAMQGLVLVGHPISEHVIALFVLLFLIGMED